MLFTDLDDDEFVKIANLHVEVLNHALRDIDPSRVRMHICWGNYEGPHVCDISMGKMFDTLMSADARYVLFETSNPRHGHEWTVFKDRKSDIPEDKVDRKVRFVAVSTHADRSTIVCAFLSKASTGGNLPVLAIPSLGGYLL